jgi:hypothetical protein
MEGYPVNGLLKLSSLIDGLTERVGKSIIWLVLVVTLIGAGNAVMRYIWNYSSNAFLEIQWYLFSAIFLFGAGYTLMRNEHVRIDLIAGRSPARPGLDRHLRHHLLPAADGDRRHVHVVADLPPRHCTTTSSRATPAAWRSGRCACWCRSASSCWSCRGISELIKRFGFLQGLCPDPTAKGTSRHPKKNWRWPSRPEGRTLMTEFLIANMAPIIFASMVLFLLVGFPVAFALAANGIFFGLIGIELGLLGPQLFQALPDRIFGIMNNDTLLAIPFFTFMGLILERSGMAEDLLDTIGQLFGPLRGGLAFAVIFVGALLAATTGVVAASVISMGLISLPIMLRYGYDTKLATGVIAASGTLAQIIPPSLVLIIMADQLGKSVGDMYKGAFLPA